VTTADLTRLIFKRLTRFRFIILAAGIIVSVLLYLYAKRTPVTFISRATIFPLTSSPENSGSSNALSVLLGTDSKNFSDDASINIVELAKSRTTREAVAASVVPSRGNKTIAELLAEDINNHLSWMEDKVVPPKTREQLIIWAGRVLFGGLDANINKNNMLVLSYTGRSEAMVKIISYEFIDKISNFYIELKREKAKRDYVFAEQKADSLKRVLNAKDYQLIAIDKRTLFTNTEKLQFKVPVENLLQEKQMLNNQYVQAVANRENAAYKLQKATPVIKVLDKPEPPYDSPTKSAKMYALFGFLLGSIFVAGLAIAGIILKFIRLEATKAIFGSTTKTTTTTTASVL
jgi:hypothetical protein